MIKLKLNWHDALDLGIEGQGWSDTYEPYDRLPKKAEKMVTQGVWCGSRSATGMSVRFRSNAKEIHLRWALTKERIDEQNFNRCSYSGFDLYGDDKGTWRWVAATKNFEGQTPEVSIIENLDGVERDYILYFPLRNRVARVAVGVPETSLFSSLPPRKERPLAVYGTSIIHGAYASHSGLVYPSIVGRRLNRSVFNLGISGCAKMEVEVAELLAELDVAAYVIDAQPNMDIDLVNERVEIFIKKLRELKPATPIVLIEDFPRTNAWIIPQVKEEVAAKSARYREIVEGLIAEGVPGLTYVTGEDLLGLDNEASIDGIHPGDLGYMRMADKITPILQSIL